MRVLRKNCELKEYNQGVFKCFELGEQAILKHCPWPDDLKKESVEEICLSVKDREYIKVSTPGGYKEQPRKTICYGHSYSYSGQTHPVEKETPEFVQQLFNYTLKEFGEETNMCLLNVYLHGHHSISAHSDDEREMGDSHHVFCWVLGKQPRKAIFRFKDGKKRWTFEIPEGLYVMYGSNFQKDFTHEFPKMYETTFRAIKGEHDADWVYKHREEIKEKLRGTKHYDFFLKWCQPRISYTLRNFKEVNKKQKV